MKTKSPSSRRCVHEMTGRDFEALLETDRQAIIAEIESKTPKQHLAESRPLNKRERAEWEKLKQGKVGRPKFGRNGVKVISLSLERDLLAQADAFAKQRGLKRAELVTRALRGLLAAG